MFSNKSIGLSLRMVTHKTCYSWVCFIFPWCYRWNCLLLIEFIHKVTGLLWVWRTGLWLTQNMTALRVYYLALNFLFLKQSKTTKSSYKPDKSFMFSWRTFNHIWTAAYKILAAYNVHPHKSVSSWATNLN